MGPDYIHGTNTIDPLSDSFERSLQDKGKGRGGAAETIDATRHASSIDSLNGPPARAATTLRSRSCMVFSASLIVPMNSLSATASVSSR